MCERVLAISKLLLLNADDARERGVFGASSIERLPTERAIQGQVEAFKGLALGG